MHLKQKKDDLLDPPSSDNSDLSNDSDYRRKQHKKEPSEKGSDQIMPTFNGKFSDYSV